MCVCVCVDLSAYVISAENKPLKVLIEFSLENPLGGVQFVFPPEGTGQDAMVSNDAIEQL